MDGKLGGMKSSEQDAQKARVNRVIVLGAASAGLVYLMFFLLPALT